MTKLLVVGIVAVIGLALMFVQVSEAFVSPKLELSGNLYDRLGNRLIPTERGVYWESIDGTKFDIVPGEINHLVAMAGDGRVIGTGTIDDLQYRLQLHSGWSEEPVVLIQAGFYDSIRMDRTQLLPCTSFDLSKFWQYVGKDRIFVDMQCEGILLVNGKSGYR